MGTEVLRPQHCLIGRIRSPPALFPRRRSYYGNTSCSYNNYVVNSRNFRKPSNRPDRSEQRKRAVAGPSQPLAPEASVSRKTSSDDSKMARSSGLMMEKVTILRRGESLDSKIKSEALRKEGDDLIVIGTERLGPDPEMVPKQIRIVDMKPGSFSSSVTVNGDMYAGSAFAMSPSPSALPLPSFSKRKQSLKVVDDSATRDLRRLLRLE